MRPGWENVEPTIEAVAAWLRHDAQPSDAVIDHFGFSTHIGEGITCSAAVHGHQGGQGGERGVAESAFFRIEVRNLDDADPDETVQPFTEEEMAEVREAFETQGIEIESHWHGAGMDGGSFGLLVPGGVAPTLRAASAAYHGGCPKHSSVFCGPRASWAWAGREDYEPTAKELDEAACTWLSHGHEVAIPPAWLVVAWPESSTGAPERPDDDRNLEAVRKALAMLAGPVAEIGIHPATMTAGRKGRIEEDDGSLRFVEEEGHGVQFPAEAAIELVRLASIGVVFESETR